MISEFATVSPQVSLLVTILLIVNLLLVGLAWWNFKETRRLIRDTSQVISDFLAGEVAMKIAVALEKDRAAEKVRQEFIHHTHGQDGKVV